MTANSRSVCQTVAWDRLTVIRGVCSLYVVVSHVWFQIWPAMHPPLGYGIRPSGITYWSTAWMYNGHFAVVVFIVLSGFSLRAAMPTKDQGFSVSRFFRRRIRRICPPYYAALLLSLAAALTFAKDSTGSQWDISIPVTAEGVLTHALMLQDFFDFSMINYTHWSIAAEFHLYLLFPVFLWLGARWGWIVTLALVAAFVGLLILGLGRMNLFPAAYCGLLLYFVLGIATAAIRPKIADNPRMQYAAIVAGAGGLIVAFLFATLIGFDRVENNLIALDSAVATSAAFLIAAASSRTAPIASRSVRMLLLPIGRYSYSLYLIHAPVVFLCWTAMRSLFPSITGMGLLVALEVIAVAVSLAVSYAFYLAFERPFV